MNPIIEIQGIGKKYRIGAAKEPYLSLRDELANTGRRISSAFSGLTKDRLTKDQGPIDQGPRTKDQGPLYQGQSSTDFWALKDVSFTVNQGEAVGIIGRNGAGKSTLLKILSQITPPTEGKIVMRGRVASLLEVGTGFHPELTGRENIYMNGAILGMSRKEIARKFDEIVAFAEIDKFLDTPVKRYSSGMYVRLAFAVAAHLEPEILIVDEVLAVGDLGFQKKCLGKMNEVVHQGRTVIFVSHNMSAVQGLCERAIWLDAGQVRMSGNPRDVVSQYLLASSSKYKSLDLEQMPRAAGGDDIRFMALELLDKKKQGTRHFEYGDQMIMRFHFRILNQRYPYFGIEWTICNAEAIRILYTSSSPQGNLLFVPTGNTGCVECRIPFLPLTSGSYVINCMLSLPHQCRIDQVDGAAGFDVIRCDAFSNGFDVDNRLAFTTAPAKWTILGGVKSLLSDEMDDLLPKR